MIDEKKLIEEIRKRRDYWESKAAEYDEAGERYEYLMDVCDGKATELTATLSIINEQPKVAEWIPCWERLPENAKHKGAFCPKHHVKTKYGITEGWYNPDVESWYCLFWFLLGRYDETDIDFEKGDKPKVVRILDGTGEVLAWKEPSEPWEGGKE